MRRTVPRAYGIGMSMFDIEALREHLKKFYASIVDKQNDGDRSPDHLTHFGPELLRKDIREWFEERNIKARMFTYVMMCRGWGRNASDFTNYIEFEDSNDEMYFKLRWYKA